MKRRYSVDAVCRYKDKYVVIRRLNFPQGLAFPGGGIEKGEDKDRAIIREMKEETGLIFTIEYWLRDTYSDEGRDPRWPATSYVAVGHATGKLRNEKGKTEVLLLTSEELTLLAPTFIFDHSKIFEDFVASEYLRSLSDY